MNRHRQAALIVGCILSFALAGPVSAAPPPNDDISAPTAISLPSSTAQSTVEATLGPTDPTECPSGGHSVWFSYTADADGQLRATTFGSDYDTILFVGTPDGAGGLAVLGCNDDAVDLQSAVRFDAVAGTTYLLMVGSFLDSAGGELVLDLSVAPPAPSIDLVVDPIGSFDPYGVATIRGTVTCSEGTVLSELDVELTQRVGRVLVRGFAGAKGSECGPTPTPWEAMVTSEDGKFLGGQAQVKIFAFACNDLECTETLTSLAVRLRR
jgi:hypothetical protein